MSVGEILRNQLLHHAPSDRKWELIAQIIANGELAPQVCVWIWLHVIEFFKFYSCAELALAFHVSFKCSSILFINSSIAI